MNVVASRRARAARALMVRLHRVTATDPPAEVPAFAVTLPLPPSVNNLYANKPGGGGRYRTPGYEDWIYQAGWEIARQKPRGFSGPYHLRLTLYSDKCVCTVVQMPDTEKLVRGDIGNRLKAVEDLLVKHRLIDDDRHCVSLDIRTGTVSP